jgi:hypothetical protein
MYTIIFLLKLPSKYGRPVDSTINIALRAEINADKIQFFFFFLVFVSVNKTLDNTKPKRIGVTDAANSRLQTAILNELNFYTPLTNLIKMFWIKTQVLWYEAYRASLSTILQLNLLKSAGLQRRIHKSRLIMIVIKQILAFDCCLFTK